MTDRQLIEAAQKARQNAYAPYSGFLVGAALLCADGTVFLGGNVECSSFPAGNCAERVALQSAVIAGHRDFVTIAVAGGKRGDERSLPCMPCGVCRQALHDFNPGLRVVTGPPDDIQVYILKEHLLPNGFGL